MYSTRASRYLVQMTYASVKFQFLFHSEVLVTSKVVTSSALKMAPRLAHDLLRTSRFCRYTLFS